MRTNRRDVGGRKPRQTDVRAKEFGKYCIVTDGRRTEVNYFEGLKRTLPSSIQSSVVVRCVAKPQLLIDEVKRLRKGPELRRYWIVFDRDEVPDFDKIVANAESQRIGVGWSNPCFEIWLAGYFANGSVSNFENSKECVAAFEKLFKDRVKFEYKKNVQNIYDVLRNNGDETNAIGKAKAKHRNERNVKGAPSEMRCTTVHLLVEQLVAARDVQDAEQA